ncbi:hypothetical protein BAOM_4743 [Peribacillus asahii]|uniref:Uncharacterized protein n=1 Tax=Peribacillus asahii TaxID=228899 RepID=A0A3Q9RQS6_9BACI|nr:hypothetical protein BAOM_4743 [Peribacillus asahii]
MEPLLLGILSPLLTIYMQGHWDYIILDENKRGFVKDD